ncbi:UvrD-helicase domain-containing protein [Rhizobium mongolense]|uniref:UvrD-helicase domain-containing protein n=1 Tax=Rhizobium mongolense TaxID=57676 RepID=UPI0034A4C2E3
MIDISNEDLDELLAFLNQNRFSPLILDARRREALRGYDDVQACPGSGKTTLVGLKLLCLARKWMLPRRGICVLTHTNVARDEILKCISLDASGQTLRSYPHFIGTIQEFVNTFLALPWLRSRGMQVTQIDDDHCTTRLERMADFKTKAYLKNKNASLSELRYKWQNNAATLSTPAFAAKSNSDSYKDLLKIKERLQQEGAFFFSEMYVYGEEIIARSPHLVEAVRHRFPIVMIDEMQDVQGFQDGLINAIFSDAAVRLQRFGDPDQSIFDGMGGEAPNITYNTAEMQPIAESHRYSPDIAKTLQGWTSRKLALTTSVPHNAAHPLNTMILFSDATQVQVLERFAGIVSHLPADHRLTVKAVGAVAENKGEAAAPLTITDYWPQFDRSLQPQSLKPTNLCQAVRFATSLRLGSAQMPMLLDAVVNIYRLAGIRFDNRAGQQRPPTRAGLSEHLRSLGSYHSFRQVIAEWLIGPEPVEAEWGARMVALCGVLGLPADGEKAASFLEYDATPLSNDPGQQEASNIFISDHGVKIQLATIHSVKGETHDATLILETKHRKLFDVKEMMPHLLDPTLAAPIFDPDHPTTNVSLRAGFMKKLYVAASRPKHVLGIAMGRDRATAAEQQKLKDIGWDVIDLG